MNLLQLRQLFRTQSGRHDLVSAAGANQGVDFFINAGQRHLDRLDETQKSPASAYRFCEIGKYAVSFKWCRAVKEVWVSTLTARWQLEKKDLADLIAGYFTTLPSGITSGGTLYYSPTVTRVSPELFDTPADEMEAFVGYVDVISADHFAYNSILIAPPTSERLMVEIKGLFYTYELVEDTDKSYWSEVHPDILIMATMRSIEIINRNTQGVNDWNAAILVATTGIGKDLVEEEIAGVTQIED